MMCPTGLASVNSACSAYFDCACVPGYAGQGCSSPTTGCSTALAGFMTSCTACNPLCNPDAGSSSSGDGGSEAGSDGGGSDGGEAGVEGGHDGGSD
jgi:hypothetical protein